MSVRLLTDYAWSDRTATSRNSQWKAWVAFCHDDHWPVLPAAEAHFMAFIVCLAMERDAGCKHVSSRSIPQYLSAVRGKQLVFYGRYSASHFCGMSSLVTEAGRKRITPKPKSVVASPLLSSSRFARWLIR